MLDRFMPEYEVRELHRVGVRAPVEATFACACGFDLRRSAVVQTLFKGRELLLGAKSNDLSQPAGLVEQAKAWGWTVLEEDPGREIAFGAVTQPWVANPIFRGVPAGDFAGFAEPNYVKIVWNIAADPIGPDESVARTETRVIATDAVARSKFRVYWAFLSAGIILIRRVALAGIRAAAEGGRQSGFRGSGRNE